APQSPSSIQKAHLVPRRLIPANAKVTATPATGPAVDANNARHFAVGKFLVPAGARISMPTDNVAGSSSPAAQRVATNHQLFDEALLTKGALGHTRTAAEWLISFA